MAENLFVLAIAPGPVPPPNRPELNRYSFLDAGVVVDVVQPCWGDRKSRPAERYDLPNVRHHLTYSSSFPSGFKIAWDIAYFVFSGLRVFRSGRRFRVIVTYGTTRTAAAGLVLKWVTRAKLIVDIPGDPRTSFVADSTAPSVGDRARHWASHLWIRTLLRQVDRLKLLFPGQADIFPEAVGIPQSVFGDFVATSCIPQATQDGKYLLLLGHPWHLKGVDLLIQAFQRVSAEFPGCRLKIVGHCPDRGPFEALRAGDARIEFLPGVMYPQALELIAGCTVFVLPSRTEAMGRVLVEAMAARKPVIASRVGGVPHYIKHGETGLLFESENIDQLANCIRQLLRDEKLRSRLAARGYEYVHQELNERRFAERFTEMLRDTVQGGGDSKT
jgi:glycosyltransferase involved in cell wall biosynthesis